jgi:hypothetical protein
MRVTRKQLRRIIQEEVKRVLNEDDHEVYLTEDDLEQQIASASVGSIIMTGNPMANPKKWWKKESDGWHSMFDFSENDLLSMFKKPSEGAALLNSWRDHGDWSSAPNEPINIPAEMLKPEATAGSDSLDFKRSSKEGRWIEAGAIGDADLIEWITAALGGSSLSRAMARIV